MNIVKYFKYLTSFELNSTQRGEWIAACSTHVHRRDHCQVYQPKCVSNRRNIHIRSSYSKYSEIKFGNAIQLARSWGVLSVPRATPVGERPIKERPVTQSSQTQCRQKSLLSCPIPNNPNPKIVGQHVLGFGVGWVD